MRSAGATRSSAPGPTGQADGAPGPLLPNKGSSSVRMGTINLVRSYGSCSCMQFVLRVDTAQATPSKLPVARSFNIPACEKAARLQAETSGSGTRRRPRRFPFPLMFKHAFARDFFFCFRRVLPVFAKKMNYARFCGSASRRTGSRATRPCPICTMLLTRRENVERNLKNELQVITAKSLK